MSDQSKTPVEKQLSQEKLQQEKFTEALHTWLKSGKVKMHDEHSQLKATPARGVGIGSLQPQLKGIGKPAMPMVFGTGGVTVGNGDEFFKMFQDPGTYQVQGFPATTTSTPYIPTTGPWQVNTHTYTPARADSIYLVFSAQELMNARVVVGTICYCLETGKMYKALAILGSTTTAAATLGNGIWVEVYVNPETRVVSELPNTYQPEPILTKDQEDKYQEFEKSLLLKATPGRLDQEFEKQENDNEQVKIKSEPPGPPDDPDVSGTWDD